MAENSTISSQPKRRGRGPGRPFQPGQSGNPAGRPRGAQLYRVRCRALAEQLLEQLAADIESGDLAFGQKLIAFTVLSDRGGYLAGDKLATAEAARGRLMIELLAIKALSQDERTKLLEAWDAREREVLAEDKEAA